MSATQRFMIDLRARLKDVTVDGLAQAAGVSRALAGAWKGGSRVPSREQLVVALRRVGAHEVVLRAGGSNQTRPRTELNEWLDRYDRLGQRTLNRELAERWPILVGRPPAPAAALQPRAAVKQVQELLAVGATGRGTRSPETGPGSVPVLVGAGGVGKSQIAAQVFRNDPSDVRVWVDGSTQGSIVEGFATAANAVGSRGHTSHDHEVRARGFLDWLAGASVGWLVVVDNVADVGVLDGWWPPVPGRTVVTTRHRDVASGGCGRVAVPVGVFGAEESVAFLTERLGPAVETGQVPGDALTQAGGVAQDVSHHPLALAQAAALMELDGLTCEQYRDLLAGSAVRVVDALPARARADDYPVSFSATTLLSMARVAELDPSGAATRALWIAGAVDPAGAPSALWETESVAQWLANGHSGIGFAGKAVRLLHRLSLVQQDFGGDFPVVRTHPLTQRVIREQVEPASWEEVTRVAGSGLMQLWPDSEADPDLVGVLRSNALEVVAQPGSALWKPLPHPLLLHVGMSWGASGHASRAVGYFSALAAASSVAVGPEHPLTLAARHDEALWRGRSGDVEGALAALAAVVADCERCLGADHPDALQARASFAVFQGESGDVVGAVEVMRDLLPVMRDTLGDDHGSVLWLRNEFSLALLDVGEPGEALKVLTSLVADFTRVHGPHHLFTLVARSNLAKCRALVGDPVTSLAELQALVVEMTEFLGADHGATLVARANVARALAVSFDPAGALAAWNAVVADMERVLGPDDVSTLVTRADRAAGLARSGDVAQGVADLRVVVGLLEQVCGPSHEQVRVARSVLAEF